MRPEWLMTVAQARGISIDDIPGGAQSQYTVREVALALGNMAKHDRERCYAAFAYRWGGDESCRWPLYFHLTRSVWFGYYDDPKFIPLSVRERWPKLVREQRYMERLVRLAVFEERYWYLLRKYSLWPAMMAASGFKGIDDALWEKRLSRKYEGIREIINEWCAEAAYVARKRLSTAQN